MKDAQLKLPEVGGRSGNRSSADMLTPAQQSLMSALADGAWITCNGRREAMIWRLTDLGLVEHEYAFAMPGMPTRIRVRRIAK